MGSGIVKNLLNSGHNVTVWNRTTEKVRSQLAQIQDCPDPYSIESLIGYLQVRIENYFLQIMTFL
jgi:6-phosphogluconate dehydrogenase